MSVEDLYSRYKAKLSAGTFRLINSGVNAQETMSKEMIDEYYEGYAKQMEKWPKVPVRVIGDYLKGNDRYSEDSDENFDNSEAENTSDDKSEIQNSSETENYSDESSEMKDSAKSCKKNENFSKKIADIGCGMADLSKMLPNVTNYDIHPRDSTIIQASMESLPVQDSSYDILVYSLSLMKPKVNEIMIEANRILKLNGKMIIAELVSRVNMKMFIKKLKSYGFVLNKVVFVSDYFFVIDMKKNGDVKENVHDIILKTPLYKKR